MKKEQEQKIIRHGEALNQLFNTGISPMVLCKKLRRLEIKANRVACRKCNEGDYNGDKETDKIMSSLKKILFSNRQNPELENAVFWNGDPRGYTLKIKDGYIKDHDIAIYRDWGGFGIIAPEL